MDYYKIAEEPFNAALTLKLSGMYRMSVCMATLAIDLLLKSVLYRINSASELLIGHNHIAIFREIADVYPKPTLRTVVKLSRKYLMTHAIQTKTIFPLSQKIWQQTSLNTRNK